MDNSKTPNQSSNINRLKLRVIANIKQGIKKRNLKGSPEQLKELNRIANRILADLGK